jgi:arylsulfatase A-like enzyme
MSTENIGISLIALQMLHSTLLWLATVTSGIYALPGWADEPKAQIGKQSPAVARGSPRPNILWIMADQLRYDCVGANGNRIIKTPNLDRLAQQSANFSHVFVQAPVCVPSRASFFTGRYPHSHRNRVNYTPLAASEVLLPARLHSAGYRTALVGKTHLYHHYPPTADEARQTGFELVDLHDGVYFTDAWSAYAQWRQAHDPLHDIPYRQLAMRVPKLRAGLPADANPNRAAIDEQYTDTTWTGLRTRQRLKELAAGDQPFFLFCSFYKPHGPYEVPVPFDSMYNDVEIPLPEAETAETIGRLPLPVQKLILRGKKPEYAMDRRQLEWLYRSYYGTVSHVDREVGLVLNTLNELGLWENTILVFTSDHGDQLLEHGLLGKNVFFEASIHVPLMIRCPGRMQPGQYDALVEAIDVLPTLFELVGLPEPDNCQGRSLVALCSGSDRTGPERDAVFSENIIPEVITSGGMDFTFEKGKGVKGILHPDAKMVRTRRWKYNYYPTGYEELYDLENDPGERYNLAADPMHKPILDGLKQRLLNWLITADESDQIAPRWVIPE